MPGSLWPPLHRPFSLSGAGEGAHRSANWIKNVGSRTCGIAHLTTRKHVRLPLEALSPSQINFREGSDEEPLVLSLVTGNPFTTDKSNSPRARRRGLPV